MTGQAEHGAGARDALHAPVQALLLLWLVSPGQQRQRAQRADQGEQDVGPAEDLGLAAVEGLHLSRNQSFAS